MKRNVKSGAVMPVLSQAFHITNQYPQSRMRDILLPVVKQLLGFRLRHRLSLHTGYNSTVILKSLAQYGICSESLPTLMGGDLVREEYWTKWLEEQAVREERGEGVQ